MKRRRDLSPLRRRELAEDKRRLHAPQRVRDGFEPIPGQPTLRLERDQRMHEDLIRYAAALGCKRGELPLDLSEHVVWAVRHDDGTALVSFTRGRFTRNRFGEAYHFEPDAGAEPVHVRVRFLDWTAEPAVEEAA